MGLFQRIFKSHDGSHRAMIAAVKKSRIDVERAASQLEDVVTELLEENDRITRRKKRHVPKPRT